MRCPPQPAWGEGKVSLVTRDNQKLCHGREGGMSRPMEGLQPQELGIELCLSRKAGAPESRDLLSLMTDSHSTFPLSSCTSHPEPACSGQRGRRGMVNFIWGWGLPHRYRSGPSFSRSQGSTCRLRPGGLCGVLPCPVGEWGRELSPLGETGAGCSLSRGYLTGLVPASHLPGRSPTNAGC